MSGVSPFFCLDLAVLGEGKCGVFRRVMFVCF